MRRGEQIIRLAAVVIAASIDLYAEERSSSKRIIVSIADRRLILFEGDRVEKIYPVAVGKASTPTPSGDFRMINLIPNPTWYGPDKVVPPGPANPVGTRWIGLSVRGYGIHGTNEPRSIGKAASHGCVRMRRTDLEELFDLVAAGDSVTVAADRSPEVSRLLFTQVFPVSFLN